MLLPSSRFNLCVMVFYMYRRPIISMLSIIGKCCAVSIVVSVCGVMTLKEWCCWEGCSVQGMCYWWQILWCGTHSALLSRMLSLYQLFLHNNFNNDHISSRIRKHTPLSTQYFTLWYITNYNGNHSSLYRKGEELQIGDSPKGVVRPQRVFLVNSNPPTINI